jgi:hypothetical protein
MTREGTTVSELTPREWQDIEKAKAALRIDAGWPDGADLTPSAAAPQASASIAARSAADSDFEPVTPGKATPEAQGLPTAG